MKKKLTITVSEELYDKLHLVIGPRKISQFLEEVARPHVMDKSLEAGYAEAARDETQEAEALDWAEALHGDSVGEW